MLARAQDQPPGLTSFLRLKDRKGRRSLLDFFATRNKCIASSNNCLTGSNKKLVITIPKARKSKVEIA